MTVIRRGVITPALCNIGVNIEVNIEVKIEVNIEVKIEVNIEVSIEVGIQRVRSTSNFDPTCLQVHSLLAPNHWQPASDLPQEGPTLNKVILSF